MVEKTGPAVRDDEDVYRAIPRAMWFQKEERPSSSFFDKALFSADLASRTTRENTATRVSDPVKVSTFNCGQAREFTYDTRDEQDDNFPENLAHVHVYFDTYVQRDIGTNKRKRIVKRFMSKCVAYFDIGVD